MRITWVTRSFLDYRIPVYQEINFLCNNQLTVIYYKEVVPQRCQDKLRAVLGDRAIGLGGEIRFGGKRRENQTFANKGGLRIPLRPGLIQKVRKTKPDIILSDGFFQWSYAALANNAFWHTPHIMLYERTPHTERNVSKIRTIARKLASRYISAISCNGTLTKKYLLEFGYPKEQLFIGNMAADSKGLQETISKINDQQLKNLKNKYKLKGPILLYVGQIIPRKGIMELLTVWKNFEKEYKKPQLVLLGDGNQYTDASNFIKENNIKNIHLLGRVDYTEIAQFYAMADVFIIPTLEDNWSLVVPEAMSSGLPIICSKYNGCWPELIKPDNGWVFDPLDTKNFIFTLQTAWENRNRWENMGKNSLEIIKDYTPEKIALRLFASINYVLNNER